MLEAVKGLAAGGVEELRELQALRCFQVVSSRWVDPSCALSCRRADVILTRVRALANPMGRNTAAEALPRHCRWNAID